MAHMTNSIKDFYARAAQRYQEQCARGEHDAECEYRVEGFYLCHCKKRARLAEGRAEPPELLLRSPICGACYGELECDGDGFVCHTCHASWSVHAGDGDRGEWTDDYGSNLAAEVAEWERAAVSR